MLDPEITQNLCPGPHGFWQAETTSGVSYPDEAHGLLFDIEDQSFWFHHRNGCILAVLERFPPRGLILDIGGGNGYVTQGLLAAGYRAALLEAGINGVLNARSRGIRDIIHATFEDACILDAAIDNAGLFDVLEHVENDDAFLAKIRMALKPGGKLYLTVPAHPYLWSWTDERAGHFRRYTPSTLQRALEQAGFHLAFQSFFFCGLSIPILFSRTLPTRLNIKPDRSHAHRTKTHTRHRGRLGSFFNRLMRYETRLLKSRQLPFGASIIAVATRAA